MRNNIFFSVGCICAAGNYAIYWMYPSWSSLVNLAFAVIMAVCLARVLHRMRLIWMANKMSKEGLRIIEQSDKAFNAGSLSAMELHADQLQAHLQRMKDLQAKIDSAD